MRKAGAWYTYEGDQLGQGKENARNFLRDNADICNEIEKKIKEKLGVGPRLDNDPAAAYRSRARGRQPADVMPWNRSRDDDPWSTASSRLPVVRAVSPGGTTPRTPRGATTTRGRWMTSKLTPPL